MTAYSPGAIRSAIKSLLLGQIGAVRTVTANTFKYGTFEGQPEIATRARVVDPAYKHRFDVKLGAMQSHGATPVGAISPTKTVTVPVTIDILTRLKSTTQEVERDEQRTLAETNTELALQALERPGNLLFDASANPTGIVSGLLMGEGGQGHPRWSVVEEDWRRLNHRSRISGSVVVIVDQPVTT
jgi:hypothetical protein